MHRYKEIIERVFQGCWFGFSVSIYFEAANTFLGILVDANNRFNTIPCFALIFLMFLENSFGNNLLCFFLSRR